MKKRLSVLLLVYFIGLGLFAQSPPFIPYQAIARDAAGQVKSNAPIQVEFKIFNSMVGASTVYDEVHSLTTNDFGYFNLRIGGGTVQSGSFSAINWQGGSVSYEVWVDMGMGYSQLGGRTGFLSVPYALYAANSSPNPTISINAPNSISSPSTAVYNINVPSPSLSITNNTLSLVNGNSVVLPAIGSGSYSAGNGINITGSVIANSLPDQTVTIAGTSGVYPNFTVTAAQQTSVFAGNSNINVSGSAPNYSISSTPTLNIAGNQLSISHGNSITLPLQPAINIAAGDNISVVGSSPDFTVSSVQPTLLVTGNATLTGVYPNLGINVGTQTLSLSGNTLSLSSNGGTVNLPSSPSTTIIQGSNVTVSGAAPFYTIDAITPTLTGLGNAAVSGSYPNQSITVNPQTLSLNGSSLTLSNGGGSVSLPSAPSTTITQGSNVTVSGAAPFYTIDAITPTLTGLGNAAVSGSYPNQSITVNPQTLSLNGSSLTLSNGGGSVSLPSAPSTTITQGSNVTVSGAAPFYTIDAITPTLTGLGNAAVSGSYPNQSITVNPQTLSLSGSSLTLSNGGGSVSLPSTPSTTITQGSNVTVSGSAPSYTVSAITPTLAGDGNATLSGSYPNQTITVNPQVLSLNGNSLSLSNGGGSVTLNTWSSVGNSGMALPGNFIGTTDNVGLAIRTNNSERMRITSGGGIGIGTTSPAADFDINSGDIKLGAGSTPFSIVKYGSLSGSITLALLASNATGTISLPGAQVGDIVVVTLNNHSAGAGALSLNNAYISANNVLTYNVSSPLIGLLISMNFSYILMRP